MKSARRFTVVLVTAPTLKIARALAKRALNSRLVACANLVPGLESHYWWKGKLERSPEILVILKTTRAKLAALEKMRLANHPYDTAEILALPVTAGTRRYLDWLAANIP